MLHNNITHFLHYCKTSNYSANALDAFATRLKEFQLFTDSLPISSIPQITYIHLSQFVADFNHPSIHVKKQRIWTLRQFFHFLKLNNIIEQNIALKLPYPKIGKKIPKYLNMNEFKQILAFFANKANSLQGLRNLIIVMLFGFLGLRLKSVLNLNVIDIDLKSSVIWFQEKGNRKRCLPLPQLLCECLASYLNILDLKQGPLFLSKQNKRLSERALQHIFKKAMDQIHINKHLHAHLFRHTAATMLNKVAGPVITQHVLGHARRKNTNIYTHLNPDLYAVYMKKHPYMTL